MRGKRITDYLRWTGRVQNNTPVTLQVEAAIVAPVEARVEALEAGVAQLAVTFVSGEVHALDVELNGRRAGHVDVAGVFLEDQVGAPVIVTQSGDELALGVHFAASVRSTHSMRLFWFTPSPAPRRARVHFLIGAREE